MLGIGGKEVSEEEQAALDELAATIGRARRARPGPARRGIVADRSGDGTSGSSWSHTNVMPSTPVSSTACTPSTLYFLSIVRSRCTSPPVSIVPTTEPRIAPSFDVPSESSADAVNTSSPLPSALASLNVSARAVELAEVEGQHAAQLLGGERPVVHERLDHLGARERDDDVRAVGAVAALKQPQLVVHHRRALHVQRLEVLSEQRVERREVELDRVAVERPVRREAPREAAVAIRRRARAEAEQRPVRMALERRQRRQGLEVRLGLAARLGVRRQLARQRPPERVRARARWRRRSRGAARRRRSRTRTRPAAPRRWRPPRAACRRAPTARRGRACAARAARAAAGPRPRATRSSIRARGV